MRLLLPTLFVIFLLACTRGTTGESVAGALAEQHSLSIMTFNVQNLFDTRDDKDRDDKTYLPLTLKQSADHKAACKKVTVDKWRDECLHLDWNETLLVAKLEALAGAILQVDSGRGPDILVLQEVENLYVLERLRNEHLGAAEYLPAILIEGQDQRGIDSAFLSRLPVEGRAKLHRTRFKAASAKRTADTRGILEATFKLPGGGLLTGLAVHFPAPYHPIEMREQAYAFLSDLRVKLPDERPVFAAGDFNTPSDEEAKHQMFKRLVEPHWQLAHRYGCNECKGTYYYSRDKNWSFLDLILWSPGKTDAAQPVWDLQPGSAQVPIQALGQVWKGRSPRRFDARSAKGVSDHWPLLIRIESRAENAH